jgi:Ca2+-binding RTX toxin-like protein
MVMGTPGDDLLLAQPGDALVDAGAGIDTLRFATRIGGPGAVASLALQGQAQDTRTDGLLTLTGIENLSGTQWADALTGDAGANKLLGFLGDDVLDGGAGDDVLAGSSAMLLGARVRIDGVLLTDNDTLIGGEGSDTASYSSDATQETLVAAGTVAIETDEPSPVVGPVVGGPVAPGLPGIALPDTGLLPGVRVSLLLQGAPQDTGIAGMDTLIGIEHLTGSHRADQLTGDAGNNVLRGMAGSDILEGGEGNDLLDGGAGFDLASYAGATAAVTVYLGSVSSTGSAGRDSFLGIEGLLGSRFADTLVGDAAANTLSGGDGDDRLFGQAGHDTLVGGAGNDQLHGGDGIDTADYGAATGAVRVLLGTGGAVDTISAGRDLLTSIENISGSAFRDTLFGDAGANRIDGAAGNDMVAGGAGNDTLLGGAGDDALTGGLGADLIIGGAGFDTIRYDAAGESVLAAMDTLQDFVARGAGFDRIGFENAAGALFAAVAPTTIAFAQASFGAAPGLVAGGPRVTTPGGNITLPPGSSIHTTAHTTGGGAHQGGWLTIGTALAAAPLPTTGTVVGGVSAGPASLTTVLASMAFAASSASMLAVTQLDIFDPGGTTRTVLVVNDTNAGFDAATDMVIGFGGTLPGTLSAANFFLF